MWGRNPGRASWCNGIGVGLIKGRSKGSFDWGEGGGHVMETYSIKHLADKSFLAVSLANTSNSISWAALEIFVNKHKGLVSLLSCGLDVFSFGRSLQTAQR